MPGIGIGVSPVFGGATARVRLARDTFTDSDAVTLTAHTPEMGTWTRNAISSPGAGDPVIDTNRLRNSDSGLRVYTLVAPATADYSVFCDIVMRSDNNSSFVGPVGRQAAGVITRYHARYSTVTNVWQLLRYVNNVVTQLGTDVAQTLTVDRAYRVELRMRGSAISVLVDGVAIITQTDSAITAAGAAGFQVSGTATTTAGLHLDNFEVIA